MLMSCELQYILLTIGYMLAVNACVCVCVCVYGWYLDGQLFKAGYREEHFETDEAVELFARTFEIKGRDTPVD